MRFQVTAVEFDFNDDFGPYPDDEKQRVINQTLTTLWEADDEDDLVEEITAAFGWCVSSIDFRILLKA